MLLFKTTDKVIFPSLFLLNCVFIFVTIVEAFKFDILSTVPQNVDRNYSKNVNIETYNVGEGRIFSSTTLVVNNSTVIRAVTFIIGSLLIFLPLLMVALLKLDTFEEGMEYESGAETYSGDFSSDGYAREGSKDKKRKRKVQTKIKTDNSTSKTKTLKRGSKSKFLFIQRLLM